MRTFLRPSYAFIHGTQKIRGQCTDACQELLGTWGPTHAHTAVGKQPGPMLYPSGGARSFAVLPYSSEGGAPNDRVCRWCADGCGRLSARRGVQAPPPGMPTYLSACRTVRGSHRHIIRLLILPLRCSGASLVLGVFPKCAPRTFSFPSLRVCPSNRRLVDISGTLATVSSTAPTDVGQTVLVDLRIPHAERSPPPPRVRNPGGCQPQARPRPEHFSLMLRPAGGGGGVAVQEAESVYTVNHILLVHIILCARSDLHLCLHYVKGQCTL